MERTVDTIRELRASATRALTDFRSEIKTIVNLEHDGDVGELVYAHDNVRIVTGIECPHKLAKDKYQVVVVLVGEFTLKHGQQEKKMVPTDVCKVPAGKPVDTIMVTDDVNAKFVYMQFE